MFGPMEGIYSVIVQLRAFSDLFSGPENTPDDDFKKLRIFFELFRHMTQRTIKDFALSVFPLPCNRHNCSIDPRTNIAVETGRRQHFVARINGEAPSISSTDLSDSVIGNQLVFAADAAMTGQNRIEEFDSFCEDQA